MLETTIGPRGLCTGALLVLAMSACGDTDGGSSGRPQSMGEAGATTGGKGGSGGIGGAAGVPAQGGVAGSGGARAGAGGSNLGGSGSGGAGGSPALPMGGMGGAGGSGGSTASGGTGAAGAGGATVTASEMGMSAGCGKSGAQTGAFQAEISAADLMRGYFMAVPADYDANEPHRLVFGYHGSNYTGKMMRQYLDNEKPPLLANSIFVYPDGLPLPGQPDNVAWVLTDGERDMVFFDTLLAFVEDNYCIDRARVFVNGQSFGGLMTNALGCLRGDVIRAIAVVAGSGPRSTCKGQVAVWLTHGMDDMNVQFTSGEGSRDRWVSANHCMDMTTVGTPMQCQNYVGCDSGYPVIWCPHVDDGGHQHPSFGRAAVREFLASF